MKDIEEGLSRSFSGGGGKPSCPSTSAGDYRELTRVPLRDEGCCGIMFEKCENIGWFQISSTLSVVIRLKHQCKDQRVKIPVLGSIAMQSR